METTKRVVPDKPAEDPLAALNTGYAQSKLVTERVLANAARTSGVAIHIARVRQVGGPASRSSSSSSGTGGATWPEPAWISALLKTAETFGCTPNKLTPVDWIPVEVIASMLCGIITYPPADDDNDDADAAGGAATEAKAYHMYPREPLPWSELVAIMRAKYHEYLACQGRDG
ncbi:hypothetical protein HD806DRAFT_528655 [Xylariaceae sp. AK1471]|nr:hypothetical protein HD806DRAFT_528655 [Xylariaceae sp. AK1471]